MNSILLECRWTLPGKSSLMSQNCFLPKTLVSWNHSDLLRCTLPGLTAPHTRYGSESCGILQMDLDFIHYIFSLVFSLCIFLFLLMHFSKCGGFFPVHWDDDFKYILTIALTYSFSGQYSAQLFYLISTSYFLTKAQITCIVGDSECQLLLIQMQFISLGKSHWMPLWLPSYVAFHYMPTDS